MERTEAGDAVILRTEAVSRRFGNFVAVRRVTAEFRRRALTSIIGPNGAGKTTYFNLLSGALRPSKGRIILERRDITGTPQQRLVRLGIARSYQITSLFPQLSALENVRVALQALTRSRYNFWTPRARLAGLAERAAELLELTGLYHRRHRPAAALAHGEQRALEIAVALAGAPRLLLLDEPTAGMSPEETREMMRLIVGLAERHTVILVEHKMKLVMGISARVMVLHHGELVAEGTPEEIRRDRLVRRVYLGQREH